jgi:Protein of unknown function (DUF4231)
MGLMRFLGSETHDRSLELVNLLTQAYPAPEQTAYITARWDSRASKAAAVARKNKVRYYIFRIGFISFASLTPPAAAAQAASNGALRALFGLSTVALSLLVAVVAGLLEITKPGQRWRLYQKLRFELESAAWALAESRLSAEDSGRDQFQRFVDNTEHLLSRYAEDYLSEISQIASADRENEGRNRNSPASRRRGDPSTAVE